MKKKPKTKARIARPKRVRKNGSKAGESHPAKIKTVPPEGTAEEVRHPEPAAPPSAAEPMSNEPGSMNTERSGPVSVERISETSTAAAVAEAPEPAAEAPAPPPEAAEETFEFLSMRLADEEYGVDLLSIAEIIRPAAITAVPRAPVYIKGIISLRGNVIPIFDLRTRLGLPEPVESRQTRILIVKLEKGLMGMIADQVTDVIRLGLSRIEPPPNTLRGLSPGHLRGVTYIHGRLIILLDLQKVIEMESA